MKRVTVFFLIIITYNKGVAQHLEKGYYITHTGDTIQTEIKVPKDIFGILRLEVLEKKVKAIDSSKQELRFLDQSIIKGFSFNYKGKAFNFSLKKLTNKGSRFFEQISTGKIANCYYYFQSGYRGAKSQYFLIETNSTESVLLKNSMTKYKIKYHLDTLFKKEPEITKLIKQMHISKVHMDESLKELIDSVNKL